MSDKYKTGNDPAEDFQFQLEEETYQIPQYHIVLLDDNDHTYEYVIEMLMKIFGHDATTSYQMACTVDANGSVIVDTTHKERAEVKRDQIHNFGADWRLEHSVGSMSAEIEPVNENQGL